MKSFGNPQSIMNIKHFFDFKIPILVWPLKFSKMVFGQALILAFKIHHDTRGRSQNE